METAETTTGPAPTLPADMHPDVAEAMEDAGFKVEHMASGATERSEQPARPAPAKKAAPAAAKASPGETGDDVAAEVDKALTGAGEDEDGKPAAEAKAGGLEDDVKEMAAIRRRSAERKRAREASRAPAPAASAKTDAPAAASASPAKPAAEAPAAAKGATADEREVAQAVRDVIAQIAQMTADDEAAAAAPGAASASADDKAKRERAAEVVALRERADKLMAKLEGNTALTDKLSKLEERLADREGRQIVMEKIDASIESNADEYPILSTRRNAAAIVYQAIERHYEKHGRAPALSFVTAKVEAVLARRASPAAEPGTSEETAPAKGAETKARTPRKTVSHAHSTPPAARTGPDQRSKDQVEQDLFKSLGIASDYE